MLNTVTSVHIGKSCLFGGEDKQVKKPDRRKVKRQRKAKKKARRLSRGS